MKKRRRISQCPNCLTQLNSTDNYCPNCGQENHAQTFSLRELWNDLIGSLLNFDGKVFTTFKMIALSPGKVPKDIVEGKKIRYVPSLRFYFFVSFLYFLILNYGVDLIINSQQAKEIMTKFPHIILREKIPIDESNYNIYRDSTEQALHNLAIKSIDNLDDKPIKKEVLQYWKEQKAYDSIYLKKNENATTTQRHDYNVIKFDVTLDQDPYEIVYVLKPAYDSVRINDYKFSYEDLNLFYGDRDMLSNSIKRKSISASVGFLEQSIVETLVELYAVLIYGSLTEKKIFVKQLLKRNLSNFSFSILLIMPLSAFILYLFYFKKQPKLIPHLILTIHLHTVMLMLLALFFAFLTAQYTFDFIMPPNITRIFLFIIFLITVIYTILSIKRFYASSWLSAIIKGAIINFLYIVLLFVIIINVFMVSMI